MVSVRPRKVVEGCFNLLGPAKPTVPCVQIMFSTFSQVVTVIFTQSAKPSCTWKLGALVCQGVKILPYECGVNLIISRS